MDKYPIDLRRKSSPEPLYNPHSNGDKYCPSVYLSGDEALKLPDSGIITFRFKRNSQTETNRDGKTSYDVSLDLKEILAVKADKKAEADEELSAGEALDKLREEVDEDKE